MYSCSKERLGVPNFYFLEGKFKGADLDRFPVQEQAGPCDALPKA